MAEFGTFFSTVYSCWYTYNYYSILASTCVLDLDIHLKLQGDTKEEIENLAYTSKEINTVAGLHTYTTIGICNPEHLHTVKEIWSTLFENVDVLFYANTKAFRSGMYVHMYRV